MLMAYVPRAGSSRMKAPGAPPNNAWPVGDRKYGPHCVPCPRHRAANSRDRQSGDGALVGKEHVSGLGGSSLLSTSEGPRDLGEDPAAGRG